MSSNGPRDGQYDGSPCGDIQTDVVHGQHDDHENKHHVKPLRVTRFNLHTHDRNGKRGRESRSFCPTRVTVGTLSPSQVSTSQIREVNRSV